MSENRWSFHRRDQRSMVDFIQSEKRPETTSPLYPIRGETRDHLTTVSNQRRDQKSPVHFIQSEERPETTSPLYPIRGDSVNTCNHRPSNQLKQSQNPWTILPIIGETRGLVRNFSQSENKSETPRPMKPIRWKDQRQLLNSAIQRGE